MKNVETAKWLVEFIKKTDWSCAIAGSIRDRERVDYVKLLIAQAGPKNKTLFVRERDVCREIQSWFDPHVCRPQVRRYIRLAAMLNRREARAK